MHNLIKRDILIGLREMLPLIKWMMIGSIFIIFISLFINKSSKDAPEKEVIGNYGVCCDNTPIKINDMNQINYSNVIEIDNDLSNHKITASIKVIDGKVELKTKDKESLGLVSKSIKSFFVSENSLLEVFIVKSNDGGMIINTLWIIVCLISLAPIALSEAMIGIDFRTGRLSEIVIATGKPLKVIIYKIVAIWFLSVIIGLIIISILGGCIVISLTALIANNKEKLQAINEATNNIIADGDYFEVAGTLISFISQSGIFWLVAGALIISMQISTILMIINLFTNNGLTKKLFLEKAVAILVWLPLIIPITESTGKLLPFYSVFELAKQIGPNWSIDWSIITSNILLLALSIMTVLIVTRLKKEWPISN